MRRFTWTAARFQRRSNAVAAAVIVLLCAVWGSTFPLTKGVLETVPATSYLATRFLLAALLGVLLFHKRIWNLSGREWFYGLSLGLIYSCGQLFQTLGLKFIDASVSSFITVMYVVFTPILVWVLFRVRVSGADWVAVLLSICGLALLSLSGGTLAVGPGEILTLMGAFAFALHIVMLGRWAPRGDIVAMSVLQMGTMGLVFFSVAVPTGFKLPTTTFDWGAILFMATIAGLVAMFLQSWSQTILSATTVALMFSLEPVFASAFAIAFWGEEITVRLVWGGILILLAMQVSALGPRFAERLRAVRERETVLAQSSAELSQAFEDLVTGGLPHGVVEGEDIIGSESFARTLEGGPTTSRSSSAQTHSGTKGK